MSRGNYSTNNNNNKNNNMNKNRSNNTKNNGGPLASSSSVPFTDTSLSFKAQSSCATSPRTYAKKATLTNEEEEGSKVPVTRHESHRATTTNKKKTTTGKREKRKKDAVLEEGVDMFPLSDREYGDDEGGGPRRWLEDRFYALEALRHSFEQQQQQRQSSREGSGGRGGVGVRPPADNSVPSRETRTPATVLGTRGTMTTAEVVENSPPVAPVLQASWRQDGREGCHVTEWGGGEEEAIDVVVDLDLEEGITSVTAAAGAAGQEKAEDWSWNVSRDVPRNAATSTSHTAPECEVEVEVEMEAPVTTIATANLYPSCHPTLFSTAKEREEEKTIRREESDIRMTTDSISRIQCLPPPLSSDTFVLPPPPPPPVDPALLAAATPLHRTSAPMTSTLGDPNPLFHVDPSLTDSEGRRERALPLHSHLQHDTDYPTPTTPLVRRDQLATTPSSFTSEVLLSDDVASALLRKLRSQ